MNRRSFIKRAGVLSAPIMLPTLGLATSAPSSILNFLLNSPSDRVLVLVQLNGGNDGLHTLIGLDQYDNLVQVRSNMILPQNQLLAIEDNQAFHPAMGAMQNMYQDGKIGIIQNVGYPNQNRSHFRSTDIWNTASSAMEELDTGWMGRYLEIDHPDFPTDYPSPSFPHPLAITMGSVVSETCQGSIANLSMTLNDPFNVTYLAPGGNTPIPSSPYGNELDFLRTTIAQTNAYGSEVEAAANSVDAGAARATYPGTRLAEQLQNVATLIKGGLTTKIYVVNLGGFDTHANQTINGSPAIGNHAELLQTLSEAIAAFQEDLHLLDLQERVLGMTFSEFGRRIRSNTSFGTDHGTAAPLIVFGDCVQAGILGETPVIDPMVDIQTGVSMQYDFRDIYGSILMDWFEVPQLQIETLLYGSFTYLPIITPCGAPLPVEWLNFAARAQETSIDLDWQTAQERDNSGFEIERSTDGLSFRRIAWEPSRNSNSEANLSYHYVDRDVTAGPTYYYRLKQIDYGGDYSYSPIRVARLANTPFGEWSVGQPMPNPARYETKVQVFSPEDGMIEWTLYNAAGQRVRGRKMAIIGRRDNMISIPLERLAAGNYALRFVKDGEQHTRQLIIK